jgi:hypothetical protein
MDFYGGIQFKIGAIKIHTLALATANPLGKFSIWFLINVRITIPVNFKTPLPFEVYQKSNNSKPETSCYREGINFVQDMQFKIRALK